MMAALVMRHSDEYMRNVEREPALPPRCERSVTACRCVTCMTTPAIKSEMGLL